MQKKLRQWATENPDDQYRELSHLLCNAGWLRVAHHSVSTNQGRETAGIDGRTMRNFKADVDGNIQRLSEALKATTFEPLPVRRVYIPKANGKKRPLGIATIDDRSVQQEVRDICKTRNQLFVRATISPQRSIPAPKPITASGSMWRDSIPMPSPIMVLPGMTSRNAAVLVPRRAQYCISS
jgi:retron-type reverse transcriptase